MNRRELFTQSVGIACGSLLNDRAASSMEDRFNRLKSMTQAKINEIAEKQNAMINDMRLVNGKLEKLRNQQRHIICALVAIALVG